MHDLGIPGIVLMENAAIHVAQAVADLLRNRLHLTPRGARVAILCGGGNNGGDGLAVARHLHVWGARTSIFLARAPEDFPPDAAVNLEIVRRMGLKVIPMLDARQVARALPRWRRAHVLVDGLLGTGFRGQVRGHLVQAIEQCNAVRDRGAQVVAVDIPSGLDCDTGKPSRATIRADLTVTFVAAKPGLLAPRARPYVGTLVVAPIGAPLPPLRRARRKGPEHARG
jgi:NAD(P)H-hydrate epimerase